MTLTEAEAQGDRTGPRGIGLTDVLFYAVVAGIISFAIGRYIGEARGFHRGVEAALCVTAIIIAARDDREEVRQNAKEQCSLAEAEAGR